MRGPTHKEAAMDRADLAPISEGIRSRRDPQDSMRCFQCGYVNLYPFADSTRCHNCGQVLLIDAMEQNHRTAMKQITDPSMQPPPPPLFGSPAPPLSVAPPKPKRELLPSSTIMVWLTVEEAEAILTPPLDAKGAEAWERGLFKINEAIRVRTSRLNQQS